MKQIYANNCSMLLLGRQGENLARKVVFDLSEWAAEYGQGLAELIYQRPTDEAPYPVAAVQDGNTLVWTLTSVDTDCKSKYGHCELRWYVGDVLVKSKTWRTLVEPAMDTPSDEVPPEPQKGWVDQVLSAGSAAQKAAERAEQAALNPPKISENDTWMIWNPDTGKYEDTNKPSSIISVEDVQIAGKSIVKNGVAEIPKMAAGSIPGIAATAGTFGTSLVGDTPTIAIKTSTKEQIDARSTKYCPIVPFNLDYSVKVAMCDGKGTAWTDEERLAALLRMGVTVADDGTLHWTSQVVQDAVTKEKLTADEAAEILAEPYKVEE